jgi:hypothetical protein
VADEKKGVNEGVKHDVGKPPIGLISRFFILGIARVLAFGARKYAAHNWRLGMAWSRAYDAALRHIFAWIDGEDLDPETGENHLYHAACELMFLAEWQETGVGVDDRFKRPAKNPG